MGFCDPCPGEPKQLYVEYTYGGNKYEVSHLLIYLPFTSSCMDISQMLMMDSRQAIVDDYEEFIMPQERHKI